ncbi:chemokine-like receptor 1 [Protopterus annectens]|uniref:chemokine-like receptor 1 n=1 Tax=Protopterus annectens TaxID=7888 RepID=UPI001CFBB4F7|nr:chemokine-like receptor 1 [Protopterus annectens]
MKCTDSLPVICGMAQCSMNSTAGSPEGVLLEVRAVAYSIIFFLGVLGNGIVIWITGFKMRRTVTTTWYLNLAIADIVFVILLPLSVLKEVTLSEWTFGIVLCKTNSFIKYLNMYASLFILIIISLDRCIVVTNPVWCRNQRNLRLSNIVITTAWVSAAVFSSPYLVFRTICQKGNKTTCSYDYKLLGDSHFENAIRTAMYCIRFIVGLFIPFIIIISCYITITCRIRPNIRGQSKRSFRTIISIIVTFFVCWLPYHIVNFLKQTRGSSWGLLLAYELASGLAFFNSCINPILYVYMGYTFRKEINKSFLSVVKMVFTDEFVISKLSFSSIAGTPLEEMDINP